MITPTLHETVAAAIEAGLSVVPPRQDGSKAPLDAWKQYQAERPSTDQLREWYGRDAMRGFGVICGAVSGGLEMLELEGRAVEAGILAGLVELAEGVGLGELVHRIADGYTEATPSGGVHWLYRVDRALGNTKLARRPATADELAVNPKDKIKVLVETRGEGGYVILAPSNGSVHPSGGAWTLTAGGIATVATITVAERDALFDLCRTFDRMPVEPVRASRSAGSGERPGDRYNERGDIQSVTLDLLIRHGWAHVYSRGDVDYLRRPGKDGGVNGISASLGHIGPGVLRVFTTSTEFEDRAYSPFSVYGILEHGGDFTAAARTLEPAITIGGTGQGAAQTGASDVAPDDRHHPPAHLTRQSRAAWYFARMAGDRVRFDHGRGRWLVWAGHRWKPDEDGAVERLWLETLADRYRDALVITDDDVRVKTLDAIQSAGATNAAVTAGLDLASSMVPIATKADAWDPDPWALGCENGVLDLRTGILRDGRPEDMVSRSTEVTFDPTARCSRWLRFLDEVFAGDVELVDWYALLIGASAIGVAQELLAIHHGFGNNGKSVGGTALRKALGDYAVTIPVETLVSAKRSASEATPDLIGLRGARIAFTSEPDQTAKLRGGVLKRLASVDRMTGRALYGAMQTWDPTHSVHLATNHLPTVDDATEGFWRRVALIPWTVHFRQAGEAGDGPAEDRALAADLTAEAPGILAWIVRGAVAFAAGHQLQPFPAAVRVRTDIYRRDSDRLGPFILEKVVYDPAAQVGVRELYLAYKAWCEAEDIKPLDRLGQKRFLAEFEEHGTVRRVVDAGHGRVFFDGARIRLSTESDVSDVFSGNAVTPTRTRESESSGKSYENVGNVGRADDELPVRSIESVPSETVECSDYRAHQRHHERRGADWICTMCAAAMATP